MHKWIRVGALLTAIIVMPLLTVKAAQTYTANRYIYKSRQATNKQLYAQARDLAAYASRLDPRNGFSFMYQGNSDFLMEKHEAVIRNLEFGLRYMPHVPTLLRVIAQSYYFLKDFPNAANAFVSYGRMVPDPATPDLISYLRAQALYRADRNGEAAVEFGKADLFETYGNENMQSRMINAILLNQHDFAGFIYRRLRARYLNSAINAAELFTNTVARKKVPAAITFLESVRTRGDADAPLLKILALAYVKQGSDQKALETLTRAMALDPSDPELFLLLGDTHFKTGNAAAARQMYDQHLRLAPDSKYKSEIESKFK